MASRDHARSAEKATQDPRARAAPSRPIRSAAKFVEAALLAVLPAGVPPSFRQVAWARFEGVGRARRAVAGLIMFDGRGATVEVQRRGDLLVHRWAYLPGGNVFWTGSEWARDMTATEAA